MPTNQYAVPVGTAMSSPIAAESHPQPPEIMQLSIHIKEKKKLAVDVTSQSSGRWFFSDQDIRGYLTQSRIVSLLRALGQDTTLVDDIHDRYLLVFTILIWIGMGAWIEHFTFHEIFEDRRLPFTTKPEEWPHGCDFFPSFFDAQWQFCALKMVENGRGRSIGPNYIIPFVKYEILKRGSARADSNTYKVEVCPEYNFICSRNGQDYHTFVLKTCPLSSFQSHYNEIYAYRYLKQEPGSYQNLVHFYGSWKQRDTYYILLEYVDGGTLEEYMHKTYPPSSSKNIEKSWENIFGVCKALGSIHKVRVCDVALQGIHHDIKATNILVSSKNAKNEFDVDFKLADFGLANFAPIVENSSSIMNRDARGTQMYIAPEYCGFDNAFLERNILQAKPTKDIWSLGCVLSEAAVWSVLGIPGLEKYRRDRRAASEGIPSIKNTAYSGGFHDGEKVLQIVLDTHKHICEMRRQTDRMIQGVVSIIEEMLQEESSRPTAERVYRSFKLLLDSRRSGQQHREDPSHIPNFLLPEEEPEERIQPPELPINDGLGIHSSPQLSFPNNATSPRTSPRVTWGHGDSIDRRVDSDYLPRRVNSVRSPGSTPSSGQDIHVPPHHRLQKSPIIQATPPKIVDSYARPISTPVPLQMPQDAAITSALRDQIENGTSYVPEEDVRELHVHHLSPISRRNEYMPKPLPMEDLISWRKSGGPVDYLQGNEWLRRISGKDQVFLIDDSSTLLSHWHEVKITFDALSYLVKRADPDGSEICFTISDKYCRSKNTTALKSALDSVTPGGQCQMGWALAQILERYNPPRGYRDVFARLRRKQNKGAIIYVFTDGIWGGDDSLEHVQEPIVSLIRQYQEAGQQLRGRIGIQFIQFGNDAKGTQRLQEMDDWHRNGDHKKDIVDTEPADGDVYKMILGSIDSTWDRLQTPSPSQQSHTPVSFNGSHKDYA